MAVEGAIAEQTRSKLPITWDALSRDSRYGDGLLQRSVDTVKEYLFGTVIPPASEDIYPLRVIDFAAKLVAIEIIPAGIDFWMNQPSSETATGTEEVHSFVDRPEALRQQREDLLKQTRAQWAEVQSLLGRVFTSGKGVPLVSTMEEELLTPSPLEFGRPYAPTARS